MHVFKGFGTPDEELLAMLESNDFFGEASLMIEGESKCKEAPNGDGAKPSLAISKRSGKAKATVVCVSYAEFLTLSKVQLAALADEEGESKAGIQAAISQGVHHRTARTASYTELAGPPLADGTSGGMLGRAVRSASIRARRISWNETCTRTSAQVAPDGRRARRASNE